MKINGKLCITKRPVFLYGIKKPNILLPSLTYFIGLSGPVWYMSVVDWHVLYKNRIYILCLGKDVYATSFDDFIEIVQ